MKRIKRWTAILMMLVIILSSTVILFADEKIPDKVYTRSVVYCTCGQTVTVINHVSFSNITDTTHDKTSWSDGLCSGCGTDYGDPVTTETNLPHTLEFHTEPMTQFPPGYYRCYYQCSGCGRVTRQWVECLE